MSDNNDNDDRTIYCGNLSEKATEQILYELFFQVGPVERISLPKDKDGMPRGFAFVTYVHLCSVRYAIELFYDTKLFGRNLTLKNRNANSNNDRSNSSSSRSSQSLAYGFNNSPGSSGGHNMIPNILFNNVNEMTTQQFTDFESQRMYLAQQQILLQLAGSQMFGGGAANNPTFPSGSIVPHNDRSGHRSDFVERNKSGRDNKKEHMPYSRNRSRSPSSHNKYYERNQSRQKTRSRSPTDNRSGGRGGGNRDGSNRYSLWGNNNNNNNNYNNNNGGSRHRDRR